MLEDGTPVTMRRGRLRDLDALRCLAARSGIVCDELELARLLRSDPAQCLILCATTPVDTPSGSQGGAETLIGTGVIELSGTATMPSLILVDPAHGTTLARWLAQALVHHARIAAA